MDHATQVALTKRLLGFLDHQTTEMAAAPYVNDVSTYISAEQLERERSLLFRGGPLLVGLSGDAPRPGAYFVHDHAGIPILVVRSRSGELRAFLAVCRHRGAQVVSGTGTSNGRFTCPYHGWTYDHHGRLVSQPSPEGFEGIDPETLCLRRLPVAERHGLVFARGSGSEPIDLDVHLGGAQVEIAPLGLENYVPFAQHTTRRAMNWKLVIDTFLEAYHVPSLHERTLGPSIFGAPAAWDAFGRCGRLLAARRSIVDLRHQPDPEWDLLRHAVVLYNLFPNTMLIYQVDHVEVVQSFPEADGADRSKIVFTLYTPEPVTDDRAQRHFRANFDLLLQVTDGEDFSLGEQIQRGFHAPGHDTVIYGRNEPGVAHFHRMIRETVGSGR